MLRPDNISRNYAAILPTLRALGYACTLTGSIGDQVCILNIGRAASVDVLNDGSWIRRDGFHGDGPDDLLDLMRRERGDEIGRHLSRMDVRALVLDALNAQGEDAASVRSVRVLDDGALEAEALTHDGRPRTVHVGDDWVAVCRRWRATLICQ